MLRIIKTAITFAGWLSTSLTFTLICIPFTFLPAPKRYTNRLYFVLTTLWCKLMMLFSFIHIKISGEENLPKYPNSPSIFVVNHTSAIDIFIIEKLMDGYPHIWLTKHEYNKIPLFSILLKRMHVPVERENSRAAAMALLKAYKRAKNISSHIILFPEGKRHDDGKIHEFNPGFALLAKKLNRPVIPIFISGLHKIFPKHQPLIDYHATRPKLTIGKPFVIKEGERVEEFSERVHAWFLQKTK